MPDVLDFITRCLPFGSGYCNLHWKTPGKPGMPGKSFANPEDLIAYAEAHKNVADIYFCLSSQSVAGERLGKNVVAHKAIYLDVDGYKAEKGYGTLGEALDAVKAFVSVAALPLPSAVVCSGGGWHVYWISDKTLTEAEWRPYADGLWALAQKHGLTADAGVTTDSVRVLRVPGSFNHKEATPRAVELVELLPTDYDFESALGHIRVAPTSLRRAKTADNCDIAKFTGQQILEPADDRGLGLGFNDAPLALEPLLGEGGCPHLVDACRTHGAHYAQPLWHLDALLSSFLENGRAVFHYISKGHPSYYWGSADAMFDRKVNEKEERGLGWPSCAALEAAGCKSCAACPHKGKIRSPLNLTRTQTTPLLSDPNAGGSTPLRESGPAGAADVGSSAAPPFDPNPLGIPREYKIVNDRICKHVMKTLPDGSRHYEDIRLISTRLWDVYMSADPAGLNFTCATSLNATKECFVPMTALNTKQTLKAAFLENEVFIVHGREEDTVEFVQSWMEKVREAHEAHKHHPYGWVTKEGGEIEGFVYGGTMYLKDGTVRAVRTDPRLLERFRPYGKKEVWFEALDLITKQPRVELEILVAASFASPLLRFTGKYGVLLAATSDTGKNKSTAIDIGNAVWGNPKRVKGSNRSSLKAMMNQSAKTQNLPLYWDDVKNKKMMTDVCDYADSQSEGVQGQKMTSKQTEAETGEWESILIVGSNESVTDAILKRTSTNAASLVRVFEFEVREPKDTDAGRISDAIADPLKHSLQYNFGQVGAVYAQWLGSDPEGLRKIVAGFHQQFIDTVKPMHEERYWTSLCAILYAGAYCANKIGANFHLDQIWTFLVTLYMERRNLLESEHVGGGTAENSEAYLTGFFKTQNGNTAATYDYNSGRGPGRHLRPLDLPDFQRFPSATVNVHWVVDAKLLRISRPAFRAYLDEAKASSTIVLSGLKKHFGMTQQRRVDLASGIGGNTSGPEDILVFPIKPGSWLENQLLKKLPVTQRDQSAAGPGSDDTGLAPQ